MGSSRLLKCEELVRVLPTNQQPSTALLTLLSPLTTGHLVPMNQPSTAHDMIRRFVSGQGWPSGHV